jgi:hypothetical protein
MQRAKFGALLVTTPDRTKTLLISSPQFVVPRVQFHRLEIIARGRQITVNVNGEIVTNSDPPDYAEGRIALRVFAPAGSGAGGAVVFKKIEIRELSPNVRQ